MSALLQLEGVSKQWPGMSSPVLDGVALTVEAGETVAVTGSNGAGKTTMLRIACGLIAPDAGEVAALGLHPDRNRAAYQRQVGFLSAGNSGLYARLKVEQHLDYWARLAMLAPPRRSECVARVIERFGLAELSGKRVDRLSMGQRQRLRLSLAFLHEPRVVLLDEPRTSLDDAGAQMVDTALGELIQDGGAAVICAPTGDADRIRFDRRFVVNNGRLDCA